MRVGKHIAIYYFALIFVSFSGIAAETLVISVVQNAPQTNTVISKLRQAYSELGIQIETRTLPGTRALALSNDGQLDGEAFRIADIDKTYTNLVRVKVPVYSNFLYVYVREGKEFPVKGWESIPNDYVIGYQRGIVLVEKALEKYHLHGQTSSNLTTMLKKLNTGRIDAIISYKERAPLIRELNLDGIVMLEPELMNLYLYHYLHKKHSHIVPELTRILTEMSASN